MNHTEQKTSSTIYFFGARVDNTNGAAAMEKIKSYLQDRRQTARKVFFTNVHSISLVRRDFLFRRCFNAADLVLPDGSGLALAGRLFDMKIIENLNGTDFVPQVLSEAAEHRWTVCLLGGEPLVLERCCDALEKRFPHIRIVGAHHGYRLPERSEAILDDINAKRPDILLVALGSPLQEMWIEYHAQHIQAGVCFAVGGLFDFIAGARRRAPQWMRSMGIEWLYRFFQDPRNKWERIVIEIPSFIALILFTRLASLFSRTTYRIDGTPYEA